MNKDEENLTHWWSEFLLTQRRYDVLIRNLYVGNNEYDGVGVWFDGNAYTESPRIENIEAKLSKPGHSQGAGNRLKKQLENRYRFGGFNSLLALSNTKGVLEMQPRYSGRAFISNLNDKPCGEILQAPERLDNIKFDARERICNGVIQTYMAARKIGLPCIFVKCKNHTCRFYTGFPANVPLPLMKYDNNGHSPYCPCSNLRRPLPYAYVNQGFTVGGQVYCVIRLNSISQ